MRILELIALDAHCRKPLGVPMPGSNGCSSTGAQLTATPRPAEGGQPAWPDGCALALPGGSVRVSLRRRDVGEGRQGQGGKGCRFVVLAPCPVSCCSVYRKAMCPATLRLFRSFYQRSCCHPALSTWWRLRPCAGSTCWRGSGWDAPALFSSPPAPLLPRPVDQAALLLCGI